MIAIRCILVALLFVIILSAVAKDSGVSRVDTFDPISSPYSPIITSPSTGGTTSTGGNFATQEGYPIIKRDANPIYKDFYLSGKSYDIDVEIQGCARDFKDVLIKESIDPDLETNLDILNITISDPFSVEKKYLKKSSLDPSTENIESIIGNMTDEYIIYKNSIYIKIIKLLPYEDINYIYKIRSNNTGVFEVLTRFRLNNSIWPDLEKKDFIEVRPPEMNIITELDKSYAICEEPLLVTYRILHKIGWCKEPVNFSASFDISDEFSILNINQIPYKKDDQILLTFEPLNTTVYQTLVKYNKAGSHPIPTINIRGVAASQERVEVEVYSSPIVKVFQDNGIFISFLISILLILVSLTEFHISNKELEILKIYGIHDYTKTDYDNLLAKQNWLFKGFIIIIMIYMILVIIFSNIFALVWSLPLGLLLILCIQYIIYAKTTLFDRK